MARTKPSKNLLAQIKAATRQVKRQAGRSGEDADPERIAHAADRATREVSGLVVGHLEDRWESTAGSGPAWRALRPGPKTRAAVRRRLASRLERFYEKVDHLESEQQRFALLLREAPEEANRKGRGWTWVFVLLGSLVLGPLGPPLVFVLAFAGGYLGGRSVRRQLDAERARLDRALDDLLDAWDAAAAGLRDSSRALVDRYAAGLEKAGRRLEHRRPRSRDASGRSDLPLALPYYPPSEED